MLTGSATPAVESKVEQFYLSVAEIFELWVQRRDSAHTQRAYRWRDAEGRSNECSEFASERPVGCQEKRARLIGTPQTKSTRRPCLCAGRVLVGVGVSPCRVGPSG